MENQNGFHLPLKTKVCSEIPFSKSAYHIEPSQLIFKANQFFMERLGTYFSEIFGTGYDCSFF